MTSPDSVAVMSIREISVAELSELMRSPIRLVDVREPNEYHEAHVPGAVLVPLGSVGDHLDAFGGEGPTYIICRSGARSLRACEFVAEHGFEAVNVSGGTMAWILEGMPVVAGESPT
jgi:rhodanese-related sulfurtransferase